MSEYKKENMYRLEGKVPLGDAIPLGMQHVLAMYAGNLAPLLVVTSVLNMDMAIKVTLLQNAMFVAGLITLIQLYPIWKVGSGLPVVMGTSSGFIPVSLGVGTQFGYGAIMGASLIGGIIEFLLGFIIKPLRKILPHAVTGTVVLILGISLIGVGIQFVGGGVGMQGDPTFGSIKNITIALIVFLVIVLLKQFSKGFLSVSAILIGIIVGYIISIFMGMVDFSEISKAAWFSIPKPIFMIDGIEYSFHIEAIVPFILVYLATTVETIGDNTGIAVGGLGRDITDDELQGAVHADGFGSVFATLFGVMPNTSFSQNVGLVAMTKIVNRFILMTGAIFLILCAFVPKLGAIVASIPNCVLGGAVILMFAMISISGLNLLIEDGKISDRTGLIVAASCAVGLGLSYCPEVMQYLPQWFQNMFSQAIVGGFVTATILNIVLPKELIKNKNIKLLDYNK
ncbi:nucleobase:cation symporter-2 family protein [Clostridium sp. D53t1_180928_C8]|uniref:uracil-xanthine permease family protein n=1 Tax=Clostridium sp. D53t1_180928_C8 TaxID=2787101 RepID=UPI0018AB1EF6|nr:nucleobase:cation symporter-2 family protein [Clostridium sp. D53t1_180928_C8]